MTSNKDYAKLSDIEIQPRSLEHLGLISMYYDKLCLKDFFDSLLPKNRDHKISHGTAILAYLLNGLSLGRRQLYLFPEFSRTYLCSAFWAMVSNQSISMIP